MEFLGNYLCLVDENYIDMLDLDKYAFISSTYELWN